MKIVGKNFNSVEVRSFDSARQAQQSEIALKSHYKSHYKPFWSAPVGAGWRPGRTSAPAATPPAQTETAGCAPAAVGRNNGASALHLKVLGSQLHSCGKLLGTAAQDGVKASRLGADAPSAASCPSLMLCSLEGKALD